MNTIDIEKAIRGLSHNPNHLVGFLVVTTVLALAAWLFSVGRRHASGWSKMAASLLTTVSIVAIVIVLWVSALTGLLMTPYVASDEGREIASQLRDPYWLPPLVIAISFATLSTLLIAIAPPLLKLGGMVLKAMTPASETK